MTTGPVPVPTAGGSRDAEGLAVSVVICAYRRRERVLAAVRSCAQQTLSPDLYEMLVVNNDPTDTTLAAALDEVRSKHFAGRGERLRLIVCGEAGLSHARNAGLAQAHGEVVCFLDDDALAAPDWLEQLWRAFVEHPTLGVAGGAIHLAIPDPRPAALLPGLEGYWSAFAPQSPGYTEVDEWWQFPWGCNWSARRLALLAVGGFAHAYGRRGKGFGGGEEIVAAMLIARLGYRVATVAQAAVTHDVEPGRFTWRHVQRTIRAGLLTRYQMEHDGYLPVSLTICDSVRRVLTTPADTPVVQGSRIDRSRVLWYRKRAYLALLRRQVWDRRARWATATRRLPLVGRAVQGVAGALAHRAGER